MNMNISDTHARDLEHKKLDVDKILQPKNRKEAMSLFKGLSKKDKDSLLLGLLFALADGSLQRVGNR